ncbi:HNH endonuclease [Escherichia coli]|uniref:HNH endonuclease n=1 Tax=Escherichia coli TaxID=562 RepID=UPI0010AEF56B|nr:HNH endonuclease [Escherichia coli]GCI98630.1 HNH endonuclease [Escherichia coli]
MDNIERQRQIVDALRSQFISDPEAGVFFNRKTSRTLIGSMTHRHHGHLTVTISLRSKKRVCVAYSKAVWLYCYGCFDDIKYHIHHKNFNAQDNRLRNLAKLPKEQHRALHAKMKELLTFVRESIELTGELPQFLREETA